MINQREERGKVIAQTRAITKVNNGYLVSSQNSNKKYLVSEHLDNCNCPDCQMRQVRCKHAFAVEYYLQKATTENGENILGNKDKPYNTEFPFNYPGKFKVSLFIDSPQQVDETQIEWIINVT